MVIIEESSTDDRIEADRKIIAQSRNEIVAELGIAMRDSALSYPVYLCMPQSGDALATPLDPSDEDWLRGAKRRRYRRSHHNPRSCHKD